MHLNFLIGWCSGKVTPPIVVADHPLVPWAAAVHGALVDAVPYVAVWSSLVKVLRCLAC